MSCRRTKKGLSTAKSILLSAKIFVTLAHMVNINCANMASGMHGDHLLQLPALLYVWQEFEVHDSESDLDFPNSSQLARSRILSYDHEIFF